MAEERQVKFRYIFPKDYNPVYCNGAHGGISTHGEIIANFFVERFPIPNYVMNSINDDGTLSGIIETDPKEIDTTLIRYVSNGIILTEDSAKAIYNWLGEQINELEKRKVVQESTLQSEEK